MTMFEIYTKHVTIGDSEYKIRPLSGRFLPKLYSIFAKIKTAQDNGGEDDFLKALDNETVLAAHELCLETMKKSYPDRDAATLDEFVSQNLWQIFGAVSEVNMSGQK